MVLMCSGLVVGLVALEGTFLCCVSELVRVTCVV